MASWSNAGGFNSLEVPMSEGVCNVAEYFVSRQVRCGFGDRPAIETPEGITTYRELERLMNKAGNGLKRLGIKAGYRVMIALPDGPEFAATLFGICKLGAIAIMVDPSRAEDVGGLVIDAGAHGVIGALFRFEDLVKGCSDELETYPTSEFDDAIWLYSGGTTKGRQKIVRQRHGSYIAVTKYLAQSYLGYQSSDRTLSVPRLFFGYALGANLLFPLSVGATAILTSEHPTPEAIFRQVKTHRPTILVNTPAMIAKMAAYAAEHRDECDLTSVAIMTSAGERLLPVVSEAWSKLFPQVPLCDALGFAEHWYFVSINMPGEQVIGTVGRIIPPLEVKVCDEAGNEVPFGEVGYLWVTGPALANGYYNNEEATKEAFRDGWFVPGDLVKLMRPHDNVPRLVYVGRAGNSFKVSGRWVYPDEIADCILRYEGVLECAVVVDETESGLAKPAAFVVTSKPLAVTSVANYVLKYLAPHKCPQRIFLQEHPLPRTPLGKVDLAVLRARLKQP